MAWLSIREIVEELGLRTAVNDTDGLKSELRKEVSRLHPDKNNGEFSSTAAKERFNQLTQALEFLDRQSEESQALVPISQVTAIVKAVIEAISPSRDDRVSKSTNEYRAARRSEVASTYKLSRLSSGVFAAICGAILAFSGSLRDNAIFYPLVRRTENQLFVLSLFLCSGLFFFLTWILERRDEARSEWLLSEDGRRFLLKKLLEHHLLMGEPIKFTLRELISEIREFGMSRNRIPFLSPTVISRSLAESMAKIHIEELESRGAIKRDNSSKLDVVYQVQHETLDEFRKEMSQDKAEPNKSFHRTHD